MGYLTIPRVEHVESAVNVQMSGIYDHFEFLRSAAQSPQSPLSSAVPDRNSPQLQVGQQVESYRDSGSVWVQSSKVGMQPSNESAPLDTFLTELRSVQQFVEQHQVALFGADADTTTVS